MKPAKVNLPIDRELYQRLQTVAKEFSVPQPLLTKAILWQFVNNAEARQTERAEANTPPMEKRQ